jgi:cytochrome c oxidase cbb3-type subunit 3
MSQEPQRDPKQDRLMDHNYDGIEEYDNPMPRWWVWIFYITIIYSILYSINLLPGLGLGVGKGRIANYERDVAAAEAKAAASRPPIESMSEGALLALVSDPSRLEAGKTVFTTNCTPCHRADGGGTIGPNLTDDYWLHGGKPLQILKTVTEGVQTKGMPAWGQILKPDQIPQVVAYVISLHDTHPPNPKAPQGVKEENEGEGTEKPDSSR